MSKNVRKRTEKSKRISFHSTVCISYRQIGSECKEGHMLSCCKFVKVTEGRRGELIYTTEDTAFSHYNAQSQS